MAGELMLTVNNAIAIILFIWLIPISYTYAVLVVKPVVIEDSTRLPVYVVYPK